MREGSFSLIIKEMIGIKKTRELLGVASGVQPIALLTDFSFQVFQYRIRVKDTGNVLGT